jgi:hypothetical protein
MRNLRMKIEITQYGSKFYTHLLFHLCRKKSPTAHIKRGQYDNLASPVHSMDEETVEPQPCPYD